MEIFIDIIKIVWNNKSAIIGLMMSMNFHATIFIFNLLIQYKMALKHEKLWYVLQVFKDN